MKVTTKLWLARNQNKIIIGVIVVMAAIALIWTATPSEKSDERNEPVSSSRLQAVETSYDFGTVSMAAGKVNHTFTVRNDGTDPLTVKKIYTSCMCTTASMIKDGQTYGPFGMQMHAPIPEINQTLTPGQEVPIEVTFDPAAHGPAGVGSIQRTVYLENNGGKPFELHFSAFVTP